MRRIQVLDVWRSLAIVCMMVHHTIYDMASFSIISFQTVFSTPVQLLQKFIAYSFIILAGISSRLSHSNLRRGIITLLCALVVSAATYFVGMPVYFGILHFLGTAMIIYALIGRSIEKAPGWLGAVVSLIVFIVLSIYMENLEPTSSKLLFPFGFEYEGFYSSDYFPLLPWFFLYLLGSFTGEYVLKYRDSELLSLEFPPWTSFLGKHSLSIYLIHQPIIFGVVMLIAKFS